MSVAAARLRGAGRALTGEPMLAAGLALLLALCLFAFAGPLIINDLLRFDGQHLQRYVVSNPPNLRMPCLRRHHPVW